MCIRDRSSTNFVFFESKMHIDELSKKMLDKGVRIGRPFPPFYDWCRIVPVLVKKLTNL